MILKTLIFKFNDQTKILKMLVSMALVVMTAGTMFSSYLRQGYTETISFFVQDGWCKVGIQGFGAHCFGDLYAPMTIANESNPWSGNLQLAYTPLNFAYFRVLDSPIVGNLGSHASLIINITLTIFALAIPGLYIWRNQNEFKNVSGPWVVLISLTSGPSIIMLDRGSSSFLLFPLVFFFYRAIQAHQFSVALAALVAMTLWKPQTAMLALGILAFFGIRDFIKSMTIIAGSFAFSFLLYPSNVFNNFLQWLNNSMAYQNYVPIPTPGNYSLVNFVGFVQGGLNFLKGESTNLVDLFRPPLPNSFVSAFSLVYGVVIVALVLITRKKITSDQFILISSIFLLTLPGTSFGYYLTLMLLPIFLVDIRKNLNDDKSGTKNLFIVYIVLLGFMVPAWPINWGNLPFEVGPAWSTLGVHWTLVHTITSIIVVMSVVKLIQLSVFNDKNVRVGEYE